MIRRVSRTHHIPLDRRTLHGHFSRELAAVITVDPGDSVEFQALDAGWHWSSMASGSITASRGWTTGTPCSAPSRSAERVPARPWL